VLGRKEVVVWFPTTEIPLFYLQPCLPQASYKKLNLFKRKILAAVGCQLSALSYKLLAKS
jgi:hypothetical protein